MRAPIRVVAVAGTRPNFMKVAPVLAEMRARSAAFEPVFVHTGQHFDAAMSEVFFEQLGVGDPDVRLEVGPGSHAETTARTLERMEPVLLERQPDVVLVAGDVNSTLAAALAAAKLRIPVGHIEAGLRSFDRTMPEEINRILTDAISDHLFIHSPEARGHLLSEGRPEHAIHDVGNTMIDTLVALRGAIRQRGQARSLGLVPGSYLLVTLHRPALVDGPLLGDALGALSDLAKSMPVVFVVHPRTRARMEAQRLGAEDVILIDPVGYVDFLSLVEDAAGVLTDSGGIQEETTYLGIPCLTLRDNTERPVTTTIGTNLLIGLAPERIRAVAELLGEVRARETAVPVGWDGSAAVRIVDVLESL